MDISGSDIIMFGGWTKTSGHKEKHEPKDGSCDYFMIWSTNTMSWKKGKYIGVPPTTRFGHTSTAIGPHLLIFGGWEYSKAQNEIIVLRECTSRMGSKKGESEMDEEGAMMSEGEYRGQYEEEGEYDENQDNINEENEDQDG
mmetsp:Transcript_7639/g.8634  ORF Transcript_7639/g.8634 Transcript_7639/m.8634 type:complete len:142 (-) Transcript_7639:31-456(-)